MEEEVTMVLESDQDQKVVTITILSDIEMNDKDFCDVLNSLIADVRQAEGDYLRRMGGVDNLLN